MYTCAANVPEYLIDIIHVQYPKDYYKRIKTIIIEKDYLIQNFLNRV